MVSLPLPALGIDQISQETALPEGTVRRAENVDIARDGTFRARRGYTVALSGSGFHSVHALSRGLFVLGQDRTAYLVTPSMSVLGQWVFDEPGALAALEADTGDAYISNGHALVRLRAGALHFEPAGVAPPSRLPLVTTQTGASLPPLAPGVVEAGILEPGITEEGTAAVSSVVEAGILEDGIVEAEPPPALPSEIDAATQGRDRTGLALAWESPDGELSPLVFLGAFAGEGPFHFRHLEIHPLRRYRVFRTALNGEVLHECDSFPAMVQDYTLSRTTADGQTGELGLDSMPGGAFMAWHGGRLFVAHGSTLIYSEPFAPHVTRPGHNFIAFNGLIRFVLSIGQGLYVGDDAGITYLAGVDADTLSRIHLTSSKALYGTGIRITGDWLGGELASITNGALWLSEQGYCLGTEGRVIHLNKGRVRIDPDTEGRTALIEHHGIKQAITPLWHGSQRMRYALALNSLDEDSTP